MHKNVIKYAAMSSTGFVESTDSCLNSTETQSRYGLRRHAIDSIPVLRYLLGVP